MASRDHLGPSKKDVGKNEERSQLSIALGYHATPRCGELADA